MNPIENLRYSLGFLVGADNEKVAGHFRRIDFPAPLAVHPRTQIAITHDGTGPLAILGEIVHPDLPDLDLQGIANHLSENPGTRQQEVDKLVGRFALIRGDDGGDLWIQTDAISMRAVFFAISDYGVIAGSHARLVAKAAAGTAQRKMRPMRWGYPGIATPYASVCRLPPNCELSLTEGVLRRFFPTVAIPQVAIEKAWDVAFDRAGRTIKALAKRRKLAVSLTAGLDSRTTLAASRASWPDLTFFTYNRGDGKHQVDNNVAADLAKTFDLRHVVVNYQNERNPALLRVIEDNAFESHQRKLASAYHSQFGEHQYLHIRSNLLELGRSNHFYKFAKRPGLRDGPCSAPGMARFYNAASRFKPERLAHVLPAFEDYVATTDFESTVGKASPWDMYFVEHRMGAWHAGVVLESDVSFDTVIAFNSREVVRHFMGVPQEVRSSSRHLREKLNTLLPEVADIPVNPGRYPRSVVAKA